MARRITAFVAGLALVLMACTLDAQERFGSVTGTVTDTSEAAVPGATVTVTNKETSATRVVVSGVDGVYRVPDLDPGRYSISIELQGFQKVVIDDLIVLLGRTLTADARLRPGCCPRSSASPQMPPSSSIWQVSRSRTTSRLKKSTVCQRAVAFRASRSWLRA